EALDLRTKIKKRTFLPEFRKTPLTRERTHLTSSDSYNFRFVQPCINHSKTRAQIRFYMQERYQPISSNI
ncbi:MAG: hypothetical protein OEX07_16010, partial [Gammaproteobacteria bacterium]|nr:hypothetical protein [Gammaproteobacteria bacterium]